MLRTPRSAWLASLALALVGGYFVTGYFFYRAPIGLDSSAFPVGEASGSAAVCPGRTPGFPKHACFGLIEAGMVLMEAADSIWFSEARVLRPH